MSAGSAGLALWGGVECTLAAYTHAVAERYPWLAESTPVNEPLTTARFSAPYGVWDPHARSNAAFVCACSTNAGRPR